MATAEPLPFPLAERSGGPSLDAYLSGSSDDRLRDMLAFALATAAGDTAHESAIAKRRAEADQALADNAFRLVHNRVAEIQAEAVAGFRARQPRPLGFIGAFTAGFLALVSAVALAWVLLHWLAPGWLSDKGIG